MNARLKPKDLSRFLAILLFALAFLAPTTTARAQGFTNLALFAFGPSNAIPKNSLLTYTIFVTNTTTSTITDVLVTNALPAAVLVVAATNDHSGLIFTNATAVVVFDTFQLLGLGDVATMSLTVRPLASGQFTNVISMSGNNVQSNFTGLIVTQVTNQPAPEADLAIAIAGPVQAVITNDYMIYGVTVSNLGPNDASSIMLTNGLAGVKFITSSPGKFTPTLSSSNVFFNLGTLASGAFTNLSLTVQPTNAGPLTLSASVGSASITDLNSTNDTASASIVVTNYLPGVFFVTLGSTQSLDFLNGLMEQTIVLSNAGPTSVDSVRVVVSGLTNQLYDAVGTNNGNPFVAYGATLGPNQSVNLLLQYYVPTHRPTPASFEAFGVPAFNLVPPAGTLVSGVNMLTLPSGSFIPGSIAIDFPSLSNRTYTVVYSDNVAFSNALAAQPSVQTFANFTIWIDYGPPLTVSHPTQTPMRFYRVLLNPQP